MIDTTKRTLIDNDVLIAIFNNIPYVWIDNIWIEVVKGTMERGCEK